jgi:peptide/nickel transport system substrate-binding protein
LPRAEILEKVGRGYGSLGNDQPISPLQRYYTQLPQREFDLDKAKHHYQQAGSPALPPLQTSEVAFPGAVDAALLLQNTAAQAGIKLEVVREPADGYWSNVWLKAPFCMSYWTGRPTEDWMFTAGYESTAAWNEAHWKNERFDSLLREARSELDDAKRREMYGEMQMIVHEQGAQLIPMFADTVLAANKKVQFKEPLVGNFELDGFRAYERWWFA